MGKRAAETAGKGLFAEEYREMIVRTHRKKMRERPKPKVGDNPFAVFSEWASEIDEKSYGGL
jgi:hypothetical protein